jgi:hypothetical protein
MAQNMPLRVTVSLNQHRQESLDHSIGHSIPAVYEYRLVSSPPLNLCYLFYHIHYTPQVGALSIWCPAGDVKLGHSVSLVCLHIKCIMYRNFYLPMWRTFLCMTLSVLMVNPSRASSFTRSTVYSPNTADSPTVAGQYW